MDFDDFRNWEQGAPREARCALFARAALRNPPIYRDLEDQRVSATFVAWTFFLWFRGALTSMVFAQRPSDRLGSSAFSALKNNDLTMGDGPERQAMVMTQSALQAVVEKDFVSSFFSKASIQSRAEFEILRSDLRALDFSPPTHFLSMPLWRERTANSEAIGYGIPAGLDAVPGFAFWADWYRQILKGGDHPWDLWEEIALIDDAVWARGAEAVAERIAEIEADYLSRKAPYAVEIGLSDTGDALIALPFGLDDSRLYETALERVRLAMSDMKNGSVLPQHYMALRPAFDSLDRAFDRFSENAQFMHEEFLTAARRVERLKTESEIQDDDCVETLQNALIVGSDHIQASDDQVKASADRLAQLRLDRLDKEAREEIASKLRSIEGHLDGALRHAVSGTADTMAASDSGTEDAVAIFRGAALVSKMKRVVWGITKGGTTYAASSGLTKLLIEHGPTYSWLVSRFLSLFS